MTATKYTPETLPVQVSILSRWVDTTGDRPQFRFMLELKCGDRRMNQEYGGGILAFGVQDHAMTQMELAREKNVSGNNGVLMHVIRGNRLHDKDKETAILHALIGRAKVSPASVCYSLLEDVRCGEETFADFCGDLGYDEDSRKAFEIYLACQKCGAEFRKLVGAELPAIAEALQDY